MLEAALGVQEEGGRVGWRGGPIREGSCCAPERQEAIRFHQARAWGRGWEAIEGGSETHFVEGFVWGSESRLDSEHGDEFAKKKGGKMEIRDSMRSPLLRPLVGY